MTTTKTIEELFAVWAERLGLDRWELRVEVGETEDRTATMEVHRSTLYERARIIVAPWLVGEASAPQDAVFPTPGAEDIEHSVVHELLHLHLRDLRMVVWNDLDGQVHRDVWHWIDAATARAEEQCVDRLAVALVRAWPSSSTTEHCETGGVALSDDRRLDRVSGSIPPCTHQEVAPERCRHVADCRHPEACAREGCCARIAGEDLG